MSYPLSAWKSGAEVWMLLYDAAGQRWRPSLFGIVQRVGRQAMVVSTAKGRETVGLSTWPMFPSETEAQRWADENPPNMPGVSPRVSK